MDIIFEIIVPLLIIGGAGYILCWAAKEAMNDHGSEKTKRKTGNNDSGDTLFSILFIFMGVAFIIIGLSGHPQVDLVPLLVMGAGLISLGIFIIVTDEHIDNRLKKEVK